MKKPFLLLALVLVLLTACGVPSFTSPAVSPVPLPSASTATPSLYPLLRLTDIYSPPPNLSGAEKLLDIITHDRQTNTICGFHKEVKLYDLVSSYEVMNLKPSYASFESNFTFLGKYRSRLRYDYKDGFESIHIDLMPPSEEAVGYRQEILKRFVDEYGAYRMVPGAPVEQWYAWDVPGYDVFLIFDSNEYAAKGVLASASVWVPSQGKYTGAPLPDLFHVVPDPGDPLTFYYKYLSDMENCTQEVSFIKDGIRVNYSFENDALSDYDYEAEFKCSDYTSSIDMCESLSTGLSKLWGKPSMKGYYIGEYPPVSAKEMKTKPKVSDYAFDVYWPQKGLGLDPGYVGVSLDISWASGETIVRIKGSGPLFD